MDSDYIAVKFAALEEVVSVSARFQEEFNLKQRLRLLVTQGRYRKPAITALGIGIFQQLCGFNSLSESPVLFKVKLIGSVLLRHYLLHGRLQQPNRCRTHRIRYKLVLHLRGYAPTRPRR